jgi:hypothetical protein
MVQLSCRLLVIGADEISVITRKAANSLFILAQVIAFLTPNETAFAQGGGPEDPTTSAAGKMLHIFISLAKLFINIAYGFMFLIFAVGSVKAGLGAQIPQQSGATERVSLELLNLAGSVVIFIFDLMILPPVNMIILAISEQFVAGGGWDFTIEIPVPIPGEGG